MFSFDIAYLAGVIVGGVISIAIFVALIRLPGFVINKIKKKRAEAK